MAMKNESRIGGDIVRVLAIIGLAAMPVSAVAAQEKPLAPAPAVEGEPEETENIEAAEEEAPELSPSRSAVPPPPAPMPAPAPMPGAVPEGGGDGGPPEELQHFKPTKPPS